MDKINNIEIEINKENIVIDGFDLPYLSKRSQVLEIDQDLNPIIVKQGYGIMRKTECEILHGVHFDLFNIFFNRSLAAYAFGGAYSSASLDNVSDALLGEKKVEHDIRIDKMSYSDLIWYNVKDTILTLKLTQYNNSLVWNLTILLCRMTRTPIHDMQRRQISSWIKSMFYYS